MAKWRIKRHDGHGVTDLGLLPGRFGRKQIRQYLEGTAVRQLYGDEGKQVSLPIDSAARDVLLDQAAGGLLIAYDAGGFVLIAEPEKPLGSVLAR